jgi:hypothetical protein
MLRLPSDLHKRLAREADKAGRSLNQELVRRLEDSFRLRPEAIEDLTELLGGLTERHRALLEQLDLTLAVVAMRNSFSHQPGARNETTAGQHH